MATSLAAGALRGETLDTAALPDSWSAAAAKACKVTRITLDPVDEDQSVPRAGAVNAGDLHSDKV
jgi:hypothetical protein